MLLNVNKGEPKEEFTNLLHTPHGTGVAHA
jgi:hypothetical protein